MSTLFPYTTLFRSPEYMEDINSVEDLNDHKDLFEGEIIGFEPGAGTMEVTETLIEDYNLDFELVPSSEAAMLGALREAVKAEEPIAEIGRASCRERVKRRMWTGWLERRGSD